jgi:ribosomal protein L3 glutamine methyltransferase
MTILELVEAGASQLVNAGVAFGHGTGNAFDEAAWLVLWQLGLPLDTPLHGPKSLAGQIVDDEKQAQIASIFSARITTRKPAAYLTREAWLQGVAFYVDERAIVPRSLIAELLVNGNIDYWLAESTHKILDLCTGNGSLAVLAAMTYPDVTVLACDISVDALAVARINVDRHRLQQRIALLSCDGLTAVGGCFDLILCNPPYVNSISMTALPPEYQAEPAIALDGNTQGGHDGMDFIRQLLVDAPEHMSEHAVLVLEIGNERANFEAAFPQLEAIWLETSAGEDQVLLVPRDALLKCNKPHRFS